MGPSLLKGHRKQTGPLPHLSASVSSPCGGLTLSGDLGRMPHMGRDPAETSSPIASPLNLLFQAPPVRAVGCKGSCNIDFGNSRTWAVLRLGCDCADEHGWRAITLHPRPAPGPLPPRVSRVLGGRGAGMPVPCRPGFHPRFSPEKEEAQPPAQPSPARSPTVPTPGKPSTDRPPGGAA